MAQITLSFYFIKKESSPIRVANGSALCLTDDRNPLLDILLNKLIAFG